MFLIEGLLARRLYAPVQHHDCHAQECVVRNAALHVSGVTRPPEPHVAPAQAPPPPPLRRRAWPPDPMYGNAARKRKTTEQVVPGIADARDDAAPGARASRDSSHSVAHNPFEDADYPIPSFEHVYERMRHSRTGLDVADRRYRLLNYTKCFVGSKAVQWMVDNLHVDRPTAVSMGQRLMDAGIVHHVTNSEPFSDDYYFFRFQEDDDTNILNMKRVWDPSIPARHAVDLSKDLITRLACLCEEFRLRILAGKPAASASPVAASAPSASGAATGIDAFSSGTGLMQSSLAPSLGQTPDLTRAAIPTGALFASPNHNAFQASTESPRPRPHLSPILTGPGPSPSASPSLPSTPALGAGTVGDDVDYSLLAKSEDFRQYALAAAELQRVQLVGLSHDERVAFFVNIYNALCLHGYVVQGPPRSMFRRWVFFRCLSYRIAGLDMTLDDIEHGILRGNKRSPMIKFLQQLRPSDPKCQHVLTHRDCRIHFVISAGTRSDPPVRILDGENVQEELLDATLEFLSCSVKVDAERRTVTLPRIFMWYTDDFPTPERSLLQWVAHFLSVQQSDLLMSLLVDKDSPPTVQYENFDWGNADARFEASVVRRKRRRLERERSSGGMPCFNSAGGTGLAPTQMNGIAVNIGGLLNSVQLHTGAAPVAGIREFFPDSSRPPAGSSAQMFRTAPAPSVPDSSESAAAVPNGENQFPNSAANSDNVRAPAAPEQPPTSAGSAIQTDSSTKNS